MDFGKQHTTNMAAVLAGKRPRQLVQWHRPIFSQNLAMSGNNRFCAFLSTPDHLIQESIGCNDYPRLAFSKFTMAAKMDAKSHYWL